MIVVARRRGADLRRPPVRVEAVGTALRGRPSWDQFDDLTTMALRDAGRDAVDAHRPHPGRRRRRRALRRLQLHHAVRGSRRSGFCGKGEGGPFVEGGDRIARDGELPLNTHGGQLSAGRLHGYGFLHEAATQLWNRGGARQVTASSPRRLPQSRSPPPAAAPSAAASSSSAINRRAGDQSPSLSHNK